MKKCSKCLEMREYSAFSKDPRNKDGYQSQCQICRKAAKKAFNDLRAGTVTVQNKTCNKCKNTKLASEFFKDKGISDGLSTVCKDCKTETTRIWRENNRDKYNQNMREFRANNKEWAKNTDLMRTHGISLEDYNKMLKDQNGVCAMCAKPPQGKRPLVVDHNHATGKVRQLLCYGCNRALHMLENQVLFEAGKKYLKKNK